MTILSFSAAPLSCSEEITTYCRFYDADGLSFLGVLLFDFLLSFAELYCVPKIAAVITDISPWGIVSLPIHTPAGIRHKSRDQSKFAPICLTASVSS
jgi:hypothetical protein